MHVLAGTKQAREAIKKVTFLCYSLLSGLIFLNLLVFSGVATLFDFQSKGTGDDEEGQTFYAGGSEHR